MDSFSQHIVNASHLLRLCVRDLGKAHSLAADLNGRGGDEVYAAMLLHDALDLERKIAALRCILEQPELGNWSANMRLILKPLADFCDQIAVCDTSGQMMCAVHLDTFLDQPERGEVYERLSADESVEVEVSIAKQEPREGLATEDARNGRRE